MRILACVGVALLWFAPPSPADDMPPKGTRGVIPRAMTPIKVDGTLAPDEYAGAFCTPVHYAHGNLLNRAAQFYYLWDDQALTIGLRALDQKRANVGKDGSYWNGDAVEFYLDTRAGDALRGKDWTEGAVHLFYTPFEGDEVKPRWTMRPGIATSNTKLDGVELAATGHDWGYEVEFRIPWKNFPAFKAKAGSLLAIDAELCSGDGAGRTDRTFAFGSPLSVQQPASQALLQLVEALSPTDLPAAGPSAFPMWVETPWVQAERAQVQAVVAIPPRHAKDDIKVEVRLHDADGKILRTLPARIERFGPEELNFARAVARWGIDEFAPNAYFATARVTSPEGRPLVSVAPRMVQEAQMSGR